MELKDHQQQEAVGQLQFHSLLTLMECTFSSKAHSLKIHMWGTHCITESMPASAMETTSNFHSFRTGPKVGKPITVLSWDIALLRKTSGFSGGSVSKESACNARDLGSIPRSGRSPGGGNSYPLQYSCLENSMDRGAWRATVHGVAKSHIQLSS